MPQNKVSWPKCEIKMPHLCKNNATKIIFFCFAFLNLTKLEIFVQKQDIYIWMRGKEDLATSNNSNGESHEKMCSELRRSIVATEKFYINPFMFIWTTTAHKMKFSIKDFFSKCDQILSFPQIWSHLRKNSVMENYIFCAVKKKLLLPSPGLFFAGISLSLLLLLLDTIDTAGSSLFFLVLKLKQRISQNTDEKIFTAHIVTQICYKSSCRLRWRWRCFWTGKKFWRFYFFWWSVVCKKR